MEMKHAGKKILIVEDESDLREALATALSYEGYETLMATDGELGLEMALAHKPDLILLDILMPKMDGIAALKRLRHDAWGSTVRVIVMTVLDDLDKVAEVIDEHGEYIVKSGITLGGIVEKVKSRLS